MNFVFWEVFLEMIELREKEEKHTKEQDSTTVLPITLFLSFLFLFVYDTYISLFNLPVANVNFKTANSPSLLPTAISFFLGRGTAVQTHPL